MAVKLNEALENWHLTLYFYIRGGSICNENPFITHL